MKIIVVDDEQPFLEMLESYFNSEGYNVTLAHDGMQAQNLIQDQQFDLAIVDIFMPEQDGIETIKQINNVSPGTIVIAMSGKPYWGKQYLNSLKLLGADATLEKPFELKSLRYLIDSISEQKCRPPH